MSRNLHFSRKLKSFQIHLRQLHSISSMKKKGEQVPLKEKHWPIAPISETQSYSRNRRSSKSRIREVLSANLIQVCKGRYVRLSLVQTTRITLAKITSQTRVASSGRELAGLRIEVVSVGEALNLPHYQDLSLQANLSITTRSKLDSLTWKSLSLRNKLIRIKVHLSTIRAL